MRRVLCAAALLAVLDVGGAHAAPVYAGWSIIGGAITTFSSCNGASGSCTVTGAVVGGVFDVESLTVSGTPPQPEPDIATSTTDINSRNIGTLTLYVSETNQFPTGFSLQSIFGDTSPGGDDWSVTEKRARLELSNSQDAAEVAAAVVTRLEEQVCSAELEAQWAANEILARRAEILAVIAGDLLARAKDLRRMLSVAQGALAGILVGDTDAPRFARPLDEIKAMERRNAPLLGLKTALAHFATGGGEEEQRDAAAAEREMRGVVAALATDAAVHLPSFP